MRTVVLVDDEPGVVEGLSLLIDWAAHGYRIVGTAADGVEALSLIEREHPDLVITDIRMPEMDGLELIRAATSACPARYVIVSGHRDFEYARTAISLGVEEYLLKPIYEENLCATLERVSEKLRTTAPSHAGTPAAGSSSAGALHTETPGAGGRVPAAPTTDGQRPGGSGPGGSGAGRSTLDESQGGGTPAGGVGFAVGGHTSGEPPGGGAVAGGSRAGWNLGELGAALSGSRPVAAEIGRLLSRPFILVVGRVDDFGMLRIRDTEATNVASDRIRRSVSRILQVEREGGYVEAAPDRVLSILNASVVRRHFGTSGRYVDHVRSYATLAGPPRVSVSFAATVELLGEDDARLWLSRVPRLFELLRIAGPASTENAEALYARGAVDEADRLPVGSRLLHAVADGDMAGIADCLDAAESAALSAPLEPTLVTDFAGKICFELHRTVTQLGGRPAAIPELERLCRGNSGDACMRTLFADMRRAAAAAAHHLTTTTVERTSPRMERIREELAVSFTEDLTIRDLADRHGISAAYLGQLFRKEFGESFKEFRTRLRVEEAARYLRSTDLRVYQIARKVGYSSIDYFERRFLEYFGTTPTSYRSQALEP